MDKFMHYVKEYKLRINIKTSTKRDLYKLTKVTNEQNIPKIILSHYFKNDLNNLVFPLNIKYLTLSYRFNEEIKPSILPMSLTVLEFGYDFNQELNVGSLPSSITELKFGGMFNKKINPGILPIKLKKLTFGYEFNQEFEEKTLPLKLKHLIFGYSFNQDIKSDILPDKLQSIEFSTQYNKILTREIFPPTLQHLTLYITNTEQKFNFFPVQLRTLNLGCELWNDNIELPDTLKILRLGHWFKGMFNAKFLPPSLEEIHVPKNFTGEINVRNKIKIIQYEFHFGLKFPY